MARHTVSRRGFGRLAGAAGIGTALGATLTASPVAAAKRTWHQGGIRVPSMTGLDSMMKSFMQDRNIPAGQLAVTYKGRLVFARSYAWTADENLRPGPTALFRIASLSKPVTSAAVNLLIQEGRLKPGDRLTDHVDMTPPEGQEADPRLSDITVERLLQHLGGWDRDISGDVTFEDRKVAKALNDTLPVTMDQVITYGAGRELDHDPGTRYAYSNYGYMLLCQIVEKVTGQPYDTFVRRNVLKPLDITRMRLGRTLAEHRAPTEVPYFSQHSGPTVLDDSGKRVPAPYGVFRLENFDAGGGWLSSAVDLVRFASIYDEAGVLDSAAIKRTFAAPETGTNPDGWHYGMGWLVRPVDGGTGRNTWHNGSLPGTYTLLVRTYQGMSWAVLFNQRDDPSGLSYPAIDGEVWDAVRQVDSWPSHDLYDEYFS